MADPGLATQQDAHHPPSSGLSLLNRRTLLTGAAAATAISGAARAAAPPAFPPAAMFVPGSADAPQPVSGEAYLFFDPAEAALMAALFNRIIPPDHLGPGAHEAGVTFFLDRQLAGAYGRAQSYYMQGPWKNGEATQGYQSRLTPAQLYRTALAALAAHVKTTYHKAFPELTPQQQDAVLTALEKSQINLGGAPRDQFFKLIISHASEGYFADPLYGGNRNFAGWKMIGFPGAHYDYRAYVKQWNRRLSIPPIGIYGSPVVKESL